LGTRERAEFEITPYTRELDSIFANCGEASAYADDPAPAVAPAKPVALAKAVAPAKVAAAAKIAAPVSTPAPPPPSPAPVRTVDAPWKEARVTSSARTNVRAKPSIDSAVIVMLDPGAIVLVRPTGNEWWHAKAKSPAGAPVEGYIREDRLVFK